MAEVDVTPTISQGKTINLEVWASIDEHAPALKTLMQSFEVKYPNVHIDLSLRPAATYNTQVTLALKGKNPPDVVLGNNGFSLDGALVKAHLIQPLDRYAKALGWLNTYSPEVRKEWELSSTGNVFGSGNLWGVGMGGSIGGWFYNKALLTQIGGSVPTTETAFEKLLAQAKNAGEIPVMLGNIDGWEATHVFNMINDQAAPLSVLEGIAFTDRNTKWDSASFVSSAQKLADWVKAGYFPNGYDGFSQQDAIARFTKSEGLLLQCGSWCAASIQEAMGSTAGFFLPPPLTPGQPSRSTGSDGQPWHVSAASKNPDAAVLFIDWITNQAAGELYVKSGDLPGMALANSPVEPGSLTSQVYDAYLLTLKNQALMPYPDFSLPQTGSVYYAKLQEIMAGKTSPADGLAAVQANRISYYDQQGVPK